MPSASSTLPAVPIDTLPNSRLSPVILPLASMPPLVSDILFALVILPFTSTVNLLL